jgi:hypothetical protein
LTVTDADDAIRFACPHCGRKCKAPTAAASESVRCPKCQRPVRVPVAVAEDDDDVPIRQFTKAPARNGKPLGDHSLSSWLMFGAMVGGFALVVLAVVMQAVIIARALAAEKGGAEVKDVEYNLMVPAVLFLVGSVAMLVGWVGGIIGWAYYGSGPKVRLHRVAVVLGFLLVVLTGGLRYTYWGTYTPKANHQLDPDDAPRIPRFK